MGDRTDKYATDWSKKRDAWLRSGRKDDSYLLRGEDLRGFRDFVINEPRRVTTDDRGFLLASDRRADTSELMRSQDVDALLLADTDVSVVPEPAPTRPNVPPIRAAESAAKPKSPSRRGTYVLVAINLLLFLSMLGLGWMVKEVLLQLREAKGELDKTMSTLVKQTEQIEKVHEDSTQKSKAKAALEKELPEVQARRDDVSKALDALQQNHRSADAQLQAVESALAVAQDELGKLGKGRLNGKLKIEFDRLLVRRLLLMLPPRCPKDLAECSDETIDESVKKLLPKGTLRALVSALPHVIIYSRGKANEARLHPIRDGQLRKLLKLPGDKTDLLLIFQPRLSEDKTVKAEARHQGLMDFLQKTLKFPPARLLRINHAGLSDGTLKGLTPPERPKAGETNNPEAIWVVRAPGPRPGG